LASIEWVEPDLAWIPVCRAFGTGGFPDKIRPNCPANPEFNSKAEVPMDIAKDW
jgi:hypothetical protein